MKCTRELTYLYIDISRLEKVRMKLDNCRKQLIQSLVVQRDVSHTLSNTDRTFQMLTSHSLDFL